MPLLQILTNVSKDKITSELLGNLTNVLADTLGKPKEFCAVHVLPDQFLQFAGSSVPSAIVTVMSIGRLGEEENKKHSAAVFAELEKLGIPSKRAYIIFQDAPPSSVGFNRTTFADSNWNQ